MELRRSVARTAWGRLALLGAVKTGTGRVALELLAPRVAYLAGRKAYRAGDWLRSLAPTLPEGFTAMLCPSWRGTFGSTVVVGLPSDPESSVVIAKVAHDGDRARALRREAHNIEAMGDSARLAGAAVPVTQGLHELQSATVLVENRLKGPSVAHILERHPSRGEKLIGRIGAWLLNWHAMTATARPIAEKHVQSWFEHPVSRLRELGAIEAEHAESMLALGRRAIGRTLPLVSAHRDLTGANILIDGERIGVLDWEEAALEQLPLTDFFYAATDLAMTAHRLERSAAFTQAFTRDGRYSAATAAVVEQTASTLELEPWALTLALHACWLHHACNEASREPRDPDRPFLNVLNVLHRRERDLHPALSPNRGTN